jgi:polyisoprenoid-binding protein YceI
MTPVQSFPVALFLAILSALASAPLPAEPVPFGSSESSLTFTVRHFLTKVSGQFHELNGTIQFDPAHPERSGVNASIVLASVDTGNQDRDAHLRAPDFFDVRRFPEAEFRSTAVRPTGGDRAQVTGRLRLHGVTREVTLQVRLEGAPSGRPSWAATATIKRSDFGLRWNGLIEHSGAVGDEVEIRILARSAQP